MRRGSLQRVSKGISLLAAITILLTEQSLKTHIHYFMTLLIDDSLAKY